MAARRPTRPKGVASTPAARKGAVPPIISAARATTRAARVDSDSFSGHSLRAGFVTSALADGADLFKVMDVTRHREVKTLKAYDRRAKAFRDHAGKGFL
jgi:integrase